MTRKVWRLTVRQQDEGGGSSRCVAPLLHLLDAAWPRWPSGAPRAGAGGQRLGHWALRRGKLRAANNTVRDSTGRRRPSDGLSPPPLTPNSTAAETQEKMATRLWSLRIAAMHVEMRKMQSRWHQPKTPAKEMKTKVLLWHTSRLLTVFSALYTSFRIR